MKEISIEQIKVLAEKFSKNDTKWHFHILTPTCLLNTEKQYALVLEDTTNNNSYVCYSEKPYMGVGEVLVKLLHGNDVVKDKSEKKELSPSENVKKILKRANELSRKGVFWHHHMLFPDCIFNKDREKWAIIFEDPEKNMIIKSVSDKEPKSDLQHIEALFYKQKR